MSETFGHALRQVRRAAGASQRALAGAIGVDFSYVSKLENDRVPPPAAETILRMCKALRTPPDRLLALAGKLPPAMASRLVSSAAAMRFLRTATEGVLSEAQWDGLTDQLARLREVDAKKYPGMALPEILRGLFWDHAYKDLSWPADRDLVTARILSDGDWDAIRWLRKRVSDDELRHWLQQRRGRGLDAGRIRFWQLVLGLPAEQADAWIQSLRREPWGRRSTG